MLDQAPKPQLPYEGCQAQLYGDAVPVCMGGTAIAGCSNPDQCTFLYGERVEHPGYVHVMPLDESGVVYGIVHVRRHPTLQADKVGI